MITLYSKNNTSKCAIETLGIGHIFTGKRIESYIFFFKIPVYMSQFTRITMTS